jgi:hypothetical protein
VNVKFPRRLGAYLCRWRIWGLAGIVCILSFGSQARETIELGYSIAQSGLPLVQVFDDGRRTYLVFEREADAKALGKADATVMVTREGKVYFAPLDLSSRYPSIAGVYDQIMLTVGGQQATATYVGSSRPSAARQAPAPEKGPTIILGDPGSIRKTPVQEAAAPARVQPAAPAPVPPPPGPPALNREVLPNNQVVRVVAKSDNPPPPVPVAAAKARGEERAPARQVAEYRVMVPFAAGKTVLGKDGEKAMAEVAQFVPLAREIRIRAPADPGSNVQSAHGRAAEIHRLLVKAGLVRQRISIETVDAAPDGHSPQAEVSLLIDLGSKLKITTVDDPAPPKAGPQP